MHKLISGGALVVLGTAVALSVAWVATGGRLDDQRVSTSSDAAVLSAEQAAWKATLAANFVGDEACAECHADQYEAHRRSGHSRTAVWMGESELATQLDGQSFRDSLRGYEYSFAKQGTDFFVSVTGAGAPRRLQVDWLLGSGTHARTPVAVLEESHRGIEQRWSYFPQEGRIGLTPDHDQFTDRPIHPDECFGRPMDAAGVQNCLSCHMTFGPPPGGSLARENFSPNLSCERCHGPRKKHAEMARLGHADAVPPLVTFETAERSIKLCAQCHRDETSIDRKAQPHELVRFQPYGLKRSACYLKSEGEMSCSTCHDPHDRVSHDRTHYHRVCLDCHSDAGQTVCKIERTGDCIDCHMPAVEWVPGISFHDHWIRVRQPEP